MSPNKLIAIGFAALLATCLLIPTACDTGVFTAVPPPDDVVVVEDPLPPTFTAFLSANRSTLIRGDASAGRATLTATANREATFEWSLDPPNLLGISPNTPTSAGKRTETGQLGIVSVMRDPGADGTEVTVTVIVTEQGLCPACEDEAGNPVLDDEGARLRCDEDGTPVTDWSGEPINDVLDEHGDPVRCDGMSVTRTLTLDVRRPVGPLTVSLEVASSTVAPGKIIVLRAIIAGGEPFATERGNCSGPDSLTPENNGERYCATWTVAEDNDLSAKREVDPETNEPIWHLFFALGNLSPDDEDEARTVANADYTAPVATGSVVFTVTVSDAAGNQTTRSVPVEVKSPVPLGIANASAASSEIAPGDIVKLTALATGGERPYSIAFSIPEANRQGSMCTTDDCTGEGGSDEDLITAGCEAVAEAGEECSVWYRAYLDEIGSELVTVLIEDDVGATASRAIPLTIASPLNLNVTLSSEAPGVQPNATVQIEATIIGGTPPYTVCYLIEEGKGSVGGGQSGCEAIVISDASFSECTCGLGDVASRGEEFVDDQRPYTAPGSEYVVKIEVAVADAVGAFATDSYTMAVSSGQIQPNGNGGGGGTVSVSLQAADNSLCLGHSTVLTATASGGAGGNEFTFEIVGTPLTSEGESITPTGPTSDNHATYKAPNATAITRNIKVTVKENGGSSDDATVVVTTSAPPVANAGADGAVCTDAPDFGIGGVPTASGGTAPYTYQWTESGPGILSSLVEPNPTFIVAAALTGTNEVCITVTDFNGCVSAKDCATIAVNAAPAADAGPDTTVCEEDPDFTVGGAPTGSGGTPPYTFSWTGEAAAFLDDTSAENPTFDVSAAGPGTYTATVTVTDDTGCTATDSLAIIVNANPAVTASNNGPVCEGNPVTLLGWPDGMASYSWTGPGGFTSSDQNPTVSPAVVGNYELTVTDANGCTDSAGTVVVVNPNPVATAGNNGPVCDGECVTLSGWPNGMLTYSWIGPGGFTSNQQNPTVCPAPPWELYTLTVTDTNWCTDSAFTIVVVNSNPTATASNDGPVCEGADVTLLGGPNGMNAYSWVGPSGFTSNEQNPAVSPAVEGTYTLTVTGGNACTDAADTDVIVNTNPVATASNSGPVCEGNPVTLSGGPDGMASYSWTGPGGFTSSDQNPTVSPAVEGNYELTVTDGDGCIGVADTTVVVNVNPETPITADSSVCAESTGNIAYVPDAGPGASYVWKVDGGPPDTGQGTPQITYTAGASGQVNLDVAVTNTYGCDLTGSETVPIDPNPVATADNDGPVCDGADVTLLGGPGGMASYSWIGPGGFASSLQNPTVSPAVAGLYTLIVTDTNGCTDLAFTIVVVNANPEATANNDGPVCEQDAVALSGGPGGMDTYSWTGPSGFTSSEQNPTVSPAVAGTYTLTVTDANGCSDLASTEVVVNANPVATASDNGPVCDGDPVTLTGGPSGMVAYSWTGPAGFASNQQSPTVSPAVTGAYTLTVTNANGCSDSAFTIVVVNANPTATAINDGPVCDGADVTLLGGPDAMDTYSWIGPGGFTSSEQNPTVSPAVAGTYELTVTDPNGCEASASTHVVINPNPVATASNDGPVCEQDAVALSGGPGGMDTYSWTGPGGFTSDVQNPTVSPAVAGTYELTVTDGNGCSDSADTMVVVHPNPDATITPDPPGVCPGSTGNTAYVSDAGPAAAYVWVVDGGPPDIGQGLPQITYSAGLSGSVEISVTVTTTHNCVDIDSISVPIGEPDCTITADSGVCAESTGNTASVAVEPDGTYDWDITGGTIEGADDTPAISYTAGTGPTLTLEVTVTDANACWTHCVEVVTVNPNPDCTITADAEVCAGSTGNAASVPQEPGGSYAWNITGGMIEGAADTRTIAYTAGAGPTVTLEVTVTDHDGCSAHCVEVVTVNPNPDCTITAEDEVCDGTSDHVASVPDAGGGASYAWVVTGGTIDSGQGSTTISYTATDPTSVTIDVTVTDANACVSSCQKVVAVNPDPDCTITAPATVPEGSIGHVASVPDAGAGAMYQWTITGDGQIDVDNGTNIEFSPTGTAGGTMNIEVTITDANGCTCTDNVDVEIVTS